LPAGAPPDPAGGNGSRSSQRDFPLFQTLRNGLRGANMARGVLYGLGAFAGPAMAGFAFELWMPHGVLAVIAAVALLFLPIAVFGERGPPPHAPDM